MKLVKELVLIFSISVALSTNPNQENRPIEADLDEIANLKEEIVEDLKSFIAADLVEQFPNLEEETPIVEDFKLPNEVDLVEQSPNLEEESPTVEESNEDTQISANLEEETPTEIQDDPAQSGGDFGQHLRAFSSDPYADLTIAEIQEERRANNQTEESFQESIRASKGHNFVHPAEILFPYGVPYKKNYFQNLKKETGVLPGSRLLTTDQALASVNGGYTPKKQAPIDNKAFEEYKATIPMDITQYTQNLTTWYNMNVTKTGNGSLANTDTIHKYFDVDKMHKKYVKDFQIALVRARDEKIEEDLKKEEEKEFFSYYTGGDFVEIPYVYLGDVKYSTSIYVNDPDTGLKTRILFNFFGQPVGAVRKGKWDLYVG